MKLAKPQTVGGYVLTNAIDGAGTKAKASSKDGARRGGERCDHSSRGVRPGAKSEAP